MYVRIIVLNSVDADIAKRDSISLISTKVASPRIKVTMITRASISQRIRDVTYSGRVAFSFISIRLVIGPVSENIPSGLDVQVTFTPEKSQHR